MTNNELHNDQFMLIYLSAENGNYPKALYEYLKEHNLWHCTNVRAEFMRLGDMVWAARCYDKSWKYGVWAELEDAISNMSISHTNAAGDPVSPDALKIIAHAILSNIKVTRNAAIDKEENKKFREKRDILNNLERLATTNSKHALLSHPLFKGVSA